MGHCAGALLAATERFERLAHLGALQVADLDADALQRAAQDGQCREQLGMAVAAHDLGGGWVGRQAQ